MRHTASIVCSFVLFALVSMTAPGNKTQAQKPTTAPPASGYHLLKKIEVGGEGGWDYLIVDGAARRLYVSRGTRVMVFDADSGASVGEIPDTPGVHGIAIADDLGRGFTSNGRDGSVTIFELKTLKAITKVKVGKNPDCIIYDPATHRVFAFNRGSDDVSAIEAKTGDVAAPIALGGHPEFATADGKGMVFVNLDNKSEVVAIDSKKLEVKAHWPVAPAEDCSGMAIDRKHSRLFSVCGNKKMAVMDSNTGKVVADVPIGGGPDAAGFDPETSLAFSSNGMDGTLTVVHQDSADKYSVVANVPTQRGARTMALDPKTHNVFLATAQYGPPPAATPERPNPRPAMLPNSFVILVFGK
ncbi:MAG TPA: YncE family protein [Blastocatellia bacterium]|nr:YncE family protein [Blastocatellia bacterium]